MFQIRRPSSFPAAMLATLGIWVALASPAAGSWFWPFKQRSRPPRAMVVEPPPDQFPSLYYPASPPGTQQVPEFQPSNLKWMSGYAPAPAPVPRARLVSYPSGNLSIPVRRAVQVLEPLRPAVTLRVPAVPVSYLPLPPSPPPAPPTTLTAAMTWECEALARRGLAYRFGSMNPASGGLDCSGTVKCVLDRLGLRGVPRTASAQYVWLQNARTLTPVRRGADPDWIFSRLRPGDLLFWRGTYVTNRWPDVSHVMIYLGRDRRTGRPLMFGARSEGTRGLHGHAVDVFEFSPVSRGKSEFIGFGRVPAG